MNISGKAASIDAILLCGGEGRRLRPVVSDRPKSMAEIAGRPFLEILIDYTAGFGFRRFILCVGYMGEIIKEYFKGRGGIVFSEEKKPLGTGGALKNAEPLIQSNTFLVMNGDAFFGLDLRKFMDFHMRKNALISLALAHAKGSKDFGAITLGDSGRIQKFDEKVEPGEGAFVNAGVYLFESRVLSLIAPGVNSSLEYDIFPTILDKECYGYPTEETLIDIGTPKGYKRARRLLKGALKVK